MDFLSSIWDLIFLMLSAFIFIAALMTFFMVIADLFRDHELNGGWKALWIIFLIAIPIFATLVYLIFRGRGMSTRAAKQQRAAQDAAESYIRGVAATSPAEQIAHAKALVDAGTITSAEFEQLKAKALV